ncbi:MAG TPA: TusE/DsrC/DsvC family sulfur relay protein [Thiobacillaceae bacterium]|nr:TusE/DsrC/DsvC family sulfur relay protein [Thiobacillaceae bacterium]
MSYVVNGEELETGEEEFLLEANFSDDVPPVIAASEKISLTDEHWIVINWLRERFKEDGQTPNFRNMVNMLEDDHPGIDWKKKLYELFPNQPARQGARVAGLTKPYGKGGY